GTPRLLVPEAIGRRLPFVTPGATPAELLEDVDVLGRETFATPLGGHGAHVFDRELLGAGARRAPRSLLNAVRDGFPFVALDASPAHWRLVINPLGGETFATVRARDGLHPLERFFAFPSAA